MDRARPSPRSNRVVPLETPGKVTGQPDVMARRTSFAPDDVDGALLGWGHAGLNCTERAGWTNAGVLDDRGDRKNGVLLQLLTISRCGKSGSAKRFAGSVRSATSVRLRRCAASAGQP